MSAIRADLEKATAQVADLKKALEAMEKSSADEIKALQEENARVKLEMTDLTKHLRAAVRGHIGKFSAAGTSCLCGLPLLQYLFVLYREYRGLCRPRS